MSITLISSPLQGFTDAKFSIMHQKYFGRIDQYYAPYIRLKSKLELKDSQLSEIQPQENISLVPQIMTKRVDEFLYLSAYCNKLGFSEINWNLGCPYPMVAKRGLGSGQITDINGITEILTKVFEKNDIAVSIKLRLGYENKDEIFDLLPVLDKFPLKNITIHPRIGKQLYKGEVDLDTFEKCLECTQHKIIYNGDVTNLEKFHQLKLRFPSIDTWMIGRGILQNPFLPQILKSQNSEFPANKNEIFRQFHNEILDYHQSRLSGDKHVIIKMYQYWEYFIQLFPAKIKMLKKIKKAKNLAEYRLVIDSILQN